MATKTVKKGKAKTKDAPHALAVQLTLDFGNKVPAKNKKHIVDVKPMSTAVVFPGPAVQTIQPEVEPQRPTPADTEAYKMYRAAAQETRRLVFIDGVLILAFLLHVQYHAKLDLISSTLRGHWPYRSLVSAGLGIAVCVVSLYVFDSARHTRSLRRICAPYLSYLHGYSAFRSFFGAAVYFLPFVLVLVLAADDIARFFWFSVQGLLNQFRIGPWQ